MGYRVATTLLAAAIAAVGGFVIGAASLPALEPAHRFITNIAGGAEIPQAETSKLTTLPKDGPVLDDDAALRATAKQFFNRPEKYQFEVRLDTPDFAVKSWWRMTEARDNLNMDLCRFHQLLEERNGADIFSLVATADLVPRMLFTRRCQLNAVRRQLDEVKVESESRAVVHATLWPAPERIPDSASDDEKKKAKTGTRTRYVLENAGDGKWRVAEVFRFDEGYATIPGKWDRVYEENWAPYWSGTIWHP